MPELPERRLEPVHQRLRAWRAGRPLVGWAQLTPDPARTVCQYKGEATYFRAGNSDVRLWSYHHPEPVVAAIAGHLAAAGEHPAIQITVDGTPEPQP